MADRSASLAFILSMTDRITAPLAKVKMGFSDLANQSEKHTRTMGLGMGGLVGSAYALKSAMAPALEQNAALGEVQSLGVAADGLDLLSKKSLEFSIAYGENATAFVRSAYDIQSAIAGLTGSQLATFTASSNLLAKATKADASTITNYVGTMYGIFQDQADAMGKAAWVEQLTGQTATAVQMYKTTGQGMSNAFTALGASATSAGVNAAEQIAILGTLQATMSGGEAGTKYKAFLAGAYGAQQKLGLSFTDSQGRLLPMLDILGKLKGKYGELDAAEADQISRAFGGKEAMGLISQLLPKTNDLAAGIDKLGKVKGLEQAEKMAQAIADPWEKFGSAIQAVRIAFGMTLLPVLNPIMEGLAGCGASLLRWIQLFPNITRVIGIATLTIMGIVAALSLLTLTVGIARMTKLGLLTVWKLLHMAGMRSVGMFLYHTAMVVLFVASLGVMYTWMVLVRTGMLLWQGAIWLVNAAMLANPVVWIIIGIVALIAIVVAAVYYWDEWTSALLNSEGFAWVSAKLQALSDWFNSMGGWSAMAKGAWDSIVSVFYVAINSLIEMINSIPGVNIEARFGGMPDVPGLDAATQGLDTANAGENARQALSSAIPSLSPARPSAVPAGGLLTKIQNNSTSQNKGTHVENVNIHTGKAMSPLEMESMMAMAVGG